MAIIYQQEQQEQKEPKKQKKFSFFFKICMVFLLLGIVLHIFDLKFWEELSYFVCCMMMMVGIEYIILHNITYFTDKKIERVISLFFYTGIVCLILKLLSSLIFKEDYYAGISPYVEVYGIILFCLKIGVILLPLLVVLMFLKYGKLVKFLRFFS